MNNINLLPWRENNTTRRIKIIINCLTATLLVVIFMLSIIQANQNKQNRHLEKQNSYLAHKVHYLKKQRQELTSLAQKTAAINNRIELFRNMWASRNMVLKIISEASNHFGDSAYINSIKLDSESTMITGNVNKIDNLLLLANNLEKSSIFNNADVVEVKHNHDHSRDFTMQLSAHL